MPFVYKHTQVGIIILIILAALLPLIGFVLWKGFFGIAGAIATGIAIIALLFGTLTVGVTERHVQCWFGFGLIHKRFPLSEITDVAVVKNRWYYGWGIRLTPKGWMFNVSGLDAVELQLNSHSYFRIGTDEPQALHAVIRRAIDKESPS